MSLTGLDQIVIRSCQTNYNDIVGRYNHPMRLNLARGLFDLVILWNLQVASVFLLRSERYTAAYELQGIFGAAMLRGIGLLFGMWNMSYLVALWHPIPHRISLYERLAMRSIYRRDRVCREGITTLLAT
jgi:hypothetical protein